MSPVLFFLMILTSSTGPNNLIIRKIIEKITFRILLSHLILIKREEGYLHEVFRCLKWCFFVFHGNVREIAGANYQSSYYAT